MNKRGRSARGDLVLVDLVVLATDQLESGTVRQTEIQLLLQLIERSELRTQRLRPHLELIGEPELSIVLFRRPGWTDEAYAAWSRQASDDGVMLCVPTKWRGETALRLAFINPETDAAAVIDVLETLA